MTDEKLIAALVSAPTVRDAAKIAGVSESLMYKRLGEFRFRDALNKQRALLLEDVRTAVMSHITTAVNVMVTIASSEDIAPQTRLNACEGLLKYASKLTEQIGSDTEHQKTKAEQWDLDF